MKKVSISQQQHGSSVVSSNKTKTSQSSKKSNSPNDDFDVYFGRSPTAVRAAGNRRLRAIVHKKLPEYEHYRATENVADRTALISMIYKFFTSNGGRFLKLSKKTGGWVEATTKESRAKISHLFRDDKDSSSRSISYRTVRSARSSRASSTPRRATVTVAPTPSAVVGRRSSSVTDVSLSSSDETSSDEDERMESAEASSTFEGDGTSTESKGLAENQGMVEQRHDDAPAVVVDSAPHNTTTADFPVQEVEFEIITSGMLTTMFPESGSPEEIEFKESEDDDFEPIPLGTGILADYLDGFSVDLESLTRGGSFCILDHDEDLILSEQTYDAIYRRNSSWQQVYIPSEAGEE